MLWLCSTHRIFHIQGFFILQGFGECGTRIQNWNYAKCTRYPRKSVVFHVLESADERFTVHVRDSYHGRRIDGHSLHAQPKVDECGKLVCLWVVFPYPVTKILTAISPQIDYLSLGAFYKFDALPWMRDVFLRSENLSELYLELSKDIKIIKGHLWSPTWPS